MVEIFESLSRGIRRAGTAESLSDAADRLPRGGYTTFRTYDGTRVLRLARHTSRLAESAGAPLDADRVRGAVAEVLEATHYPESRIRLTFAPPRLFVLVEAFDPLPQFYYEKGVACVTVRLRRENPRLKDTGFIASAAEAQGRFPKDVHEGLIVGEDGAILEGLSSNFFAVKEGALRTEEERALLGVTRSLVLEVAQGVLPFSPGAVGIRDLAEVTECWITSASRGILPVVRIDGQPISEGTPGELTRRIMERFDALVKGEAKSVLAPRSSGG
jgi:branched-chain amino acid aminotransferase